MDKITFGHLPKLKKIPKDMQGALFAPDLKLALELVCPTCKFRVYWNLKKTLLICPKKDHKFTITRQKFEEMKSGKTLRDYKEQRRIDLR